jgi:hypothetical protein
VSEVSDDLKNARVVLNAYDELVDALRAENAALRDTSDVMRHEYRELSDEEKCSINYIKDAGEELLRTIRGQSSESRERSLAITKVEEAIVWAVKGLTG